MAGFAGAIPPLQEGLGRLGPGLGLAPDLISRYIARLQTDAQRPMGNVTSMGYGVPGTAGYFGNGGAPVSRMGGFGMGGEPSGKGMSPAARRARRLQGTGSSLGLEQALAQKMGMR